MCNVCQVMKALYVYYGGFPASSLMHDAASWMNILVESGMANAFAQNNPRVYLSSQRS